MSVGHTPLPVKSGESGAVLVSALLSLVLLVFVLASIALLIVNRSSAIAIDSDQVAVDLLTKSGLEIGVYHVMTTPKERAVEGEDNITLSEGEVAIIWRGENARLDINTAPQQSITDLIKAFSSASDEPEKIAQRIVERRGDSPQANPSPDRLNAPQIRQRPFAHPVELLSIDGLSPELYHRLSPFITIYSGTKAMDPRIASETVLSHLPGMTNLRLQSLLSLRGKSQADSIAVLKELGFGTSDLDVQRSLTTRFTLNVRLTSGLIKVSECVVAIFPDDVEPYRILYADAMPKN